MRLQKYLGGTRVTIFWLGVRVYKKVGNRCCKSNNNNNEQSKFIATSILMFKQKQSYKKLHQKLIFATIGIEQLLSTQLG